MHQAEFPLMDGLQSSPFPVSFDDETVDGFLEYVLVSSHHLQFS